MKHSISEYLDKSKLTKGSDRKEFKEFFDSMELNIKAAYFEYTLNEKTEDSKFWREFYFSDMISLIFSQKEVHKHFKEWLDYKLSNTHELKPLVTLIRAGNTIVGDIDDYLIESSNDKTFMTFTPEGEIIVPKNCNLNISTYEQDDNEYIEDITVEVEPTEKLMEKYELTKSENIGFIWLWMELNILTIKTREADRIIVQAFLNDV